MTDIAWAVAGGQELAAGGDQVWTEGETGFVSVQWGTKTYAADSRDAKLLGARFCPHCRGGVLPGAFSFCPDCGRKTQAYEPTGTGTLCQWPSYGGTGWAEAPDCSLSELSDREEVSAPQGGKWGLAVAGDPAVLVAYDHEHGMVLRHDGAAGWQQINRVAPSVLAPWQRALVATAQGLFFPTDTGGLGFLSVPFVDGGAWVCSGSATPLGGVGAFGDAVYMPALKDGALYLISCPLSANPARTDGAWGAIAIDLSLAGVNAQMLAFGAPFTNSVGDLFWSAREGYIVVAPKDGGVGATFLPWRSGYVACPAARPFRSARFGGAWQLVLGRDGKDAFDAYAYHQVAMRAARQELTAIEGPHLSYGSGTFRGDKRYDDPAVDPVVDYEPATDDNVYIPLATFGTGERTRFLVAVVEGRDKLTELLSETDLATPARAMLLLLGRRQGNVQNLLTSVDIRSLHHMSSVLHDGRVFVYANYENRIFSWRIVP